MGRRLWLMVLMAGTACAASLSGRFTDAQGRPVAGAAVWFVADDPGWLAERCTAVSATDGRFELVVADGCDGAGALLARVPGAGCAVARVERDGRPISLTLLPGDSVEGVVLDAQQRPVVGALVRPNLYWYDSGYVRVSDVAATALWSATTDAEGRWRLGDLPRDARRCFAVQAQGHALALPSVGRGFQPAPASFAILEPGGTVRGRVLLPDGRPARHVAVGQDGRFVATDADGRFRLAHQPLGEQALRVLRPAGADWCEPRELVATVRADAEVALPEVRLTRGVWLRGTVADPLSGRPRGGVYVSLDRQGFTPASARSGDDGGFELLLEPGTYRLRGAEPEQTVTLTADGPPPAPLALTARSGWLAVRLRLRDEAGQPVAGAWFRRSADGHRAVSGPDGLVPVRVVPGLVPVPDPPVPGAAQPKPEPTRLQAVTAEPWRLGTITLPDGAEQADLTLVEIPTATVAGRVMDTAGTPVAGAEVRLRLDEPGCDLVGVGADGPIVGRSGADGRFRLPPAPAEWPGQLTVACTGYQPCPARPLRLLGEPVAHDLILQPLTASVAGRVLDAEGRPVAGAMVLVRGHLADRPRLTARDGSFDCRGLPPGRLALVGLHGQRAMASIDCVAPATGLTLRLADVPDLDWSEAPTDDDRDQALALLRQVLRAEQRNAGDAAALVWLARIDPAEALEQLTRGPADWHRGDALVMFLVVLPQDVALGPDIVRVVRALDGRTQRLVAAWLASRHVSRPLAEQLRALAPSAADLPTGDRSFALPTLADLACRAGSPDAAALVDAAVDALRADPKRDDVMAQMLEVGPLSTEVMAKLPAPEAGGRAGRLLRRRQLEQALRRAPRAALDLARGWWPGPYGSVAWPGDLDWYPGGRAGLVADIALGLAADEPETARAMLRDGPTSEARLSALAALALGSPDGATARGWLAELARDAGFGVDEALVKAAWRPAPDLAEQARRRMLSSACFDTPMGRLETAYAFAAVDPVRTRWALEAAVAREAGAAPLGDTLVALAAVDRPRALVLAVDQRTDDEARLALVAWLLSDEVARCTKPLHHWRRQGAHPEEALGW